MSSSPTSALEELRSKNDDLVGDEDKQLRNDNVEEIEWMKTAAEDDLKKADHESLYPKRSQSSTRRLLNYIRGKPKTKVS